MGRQHLRKNHKERPARTPNHASENVRAGSVTKPAAFRIANPRVRLAIPLLLLAVLIPFYWVSYRAPAVGTIHDDGIYLVTAKALAEGKGYRIISLPDEPKQTKYPIGFPLLLAAVWKVFPDFPGNVPILKIIPMAALFAWLAAGILFARRWGRMSWEGTLWIVFFCAGTHWAIFLGTNFMSDLLFGALVLLSLHFLLTMETSDQPVRTAVFAGLCCAAAYTVRTAALAVMAAGMIAMVLQKRKWPTAIFAAICGSVAAAWAAWQHGEPLLRNPIQAYYTAQNYTDWNLLTAAYPGLEKLSVFVTNIFYALVFPAQVVVANGAFLPWGIALCLGTAAWLTYAKGLKASPGLRAAHITVGVYVGLVLLWAWPLDRFLTSLLPLFAVVAYAGWPKRLRNLGAATVPAAALLFSAWTNMNYELASGIPWVSNDRHLDWKQLSTLHGWIRSHAEPGTVVMANFDPAVYLFTGHKAVRPYALDNLGLFYGFPGQPLAREAMFRDLLIHNGVQYVMRSSTDLEELDLAQWVARMRLESLVTPVIALPDEYQIYKVEPAASSRQHAPATAGHAAIAGPGFPGQ